MPDDHADKSIANRQELAVFAHEVRGALTVIAGFAELMRRPLPEADREAALSGIAHAVKRIDRLVDAALSGDLDEGGPYEELDLAELAAGVVDEQRAITGRLIELHAESKPFVLGVPEALERALGNLIGNSLKYALSSSVVEVGVSVVGQNAVLSVADRGPGIPKKDRKRVLEPFERLDAHAGLPGSGLGLTVVSSIAEAHAGRVLIDEREGGGTLVQIELPLAPSNA